MIVGPQVRTCLATRFGVNNVEYNSVEDINEKLDVLLLSCKSTYPQTAIYISSIAPRKDDLMESSQKRTNYKPESLKIASIMVSSL